MKWQVKEPEHPVATSFRPFSSESPQSYWNEPTMFPISNGLRKHRHHHLTAWINSEQHFLENIYRTHIITFNPHKTINYSWDNGTTSPFYRRRNWGYKRLRNLPKAYKPLSRAEESDLMAQKGAFFLLGPAPTSVMLTVLLSWVPHNPH